ncbi:hypothetical protein AJ78_07637 [Emergomyces pasteurianus Ep9510]|uniref:Carboxylic ester hydrolase n=1 Tax=Emergomyces pasteurianus Ep9510 TaxID=1447872 RepID=A0A1J9P5F9_9EURO|nr:hypothetical protein AJ78_07637 [Emergomyces pasteurianus Ep9510]
MKLLWALGVGIAPLSRASPAKRDGSPTVTIYSPQATIIGGERLGTDVFPGIPSAKPPIGPLRLKPPKPLLGRYETKENAQACPQFFFSTELDDAIPTTPLGKLLNTPMFQQILNAGEDCLHLSIHRPVGTTESDSLPVLFWIYGRGFGFGWNAFFDIGNWVTASVEAGKPIIADDSANLGLLDQRLGLRWVVDTIATFGGNPDVVTIWGESAGSISVFDQLRGICRHFELSPRGRLRQTSPRRELGSRHPKLFFNSLIVPPSTRWDRPPKTPDELLLEGKIAKVPFILGNQEDEGTLFALSQSNITTEDQLATYLKAKLFHSASDEQIAKLISTYSSISEYGAPHRKGLVSNWYPQFKRLAVILGDLTFTLTHRSVLEISSLVHPDVPTWPYLSSYEHGLPVLGTSHGSDLVQVFFGIVPNYASRALHEYYLAFIHGQDPNSDTICRSGPGGEAYEFILESMKTFHV